MKKNLFFDIVLVVVSICWGTISLFSKPLGVFGFSAMQILLGRALLSAIFLGVFMLIVSKGFTLFKFKLKEVWVFIGSGVFGFAGCVFCYMMCIEELGAGVAAMLMYSSPIWIMIISLIALKEKFKIMSLVALIGIVAGIVMVSFGGDMNMTWTGLGLGLATGFCLALVGIFGKVAGTKGYNPLTTQFYTFVFATVVALPLSFVFRDKPFFTLVSNAPISILYHVLFALIATALPYALYAFALKNVSASTAGMITSLEVVVATIVGAIFYGENIGWLGVCGIAIMIISLILLEINPKKLKLKLQRVIKQPNAQTDSEANNQKQE